MHFRRLGGLIGVGVGFSAEFWRILDESAAKSGVGAVVEAASGSRW